MPEVEVLRRYLEPRLRGRRIVDVDVRRERMVRPTGGDGLRHGIVGGTLGTIGRRGKHLLFGVGMPGGAVRGVVGHLGMTGRMYVDDGTGVLPRHTAVALALDVGRFVYEDARQFGRFHLDTASLDAMGPEPLEAAWTAADLAKALRDSLQSVKVRLLDQAVVAGVGNIYASEALHRAGISPGRAAGRLSAAEVERLWGAVREVLSAAIELGQRASLDFAGGNDGLFYFGSSAAGPEPGERFRVYDREGEPCGRCGETICRRVQAARSTFYCPGCQR
jgi:formamidopyrimidine-DNA glycosylase